MDEARLEAELERTFAASEGERRAVVRAARDLADSGRLTADRGEPPAVDALVAELRDAPEGSSLAERWNWWLGALEIAYDGGYTEFQVRRYD
ncbi:hypothetical protein [Haloplanus halobius]|uniref:hypothetical protein n=1 Tax=Haloplanus halobius TaxID=2934938 RepID=UPI00200DFD2A